MLEVTSKQMSISHISPKLRNSKSYVQKTSTAKELFDMKQESSPQSPKNIYSFKSKMMKPSNIYFKNIQAFKTQQMENILSSSSQFGLQVNSVTNSTNTSIVVSQEYICKSPVRIKSPGEVKRKHPYLQFYGSSRRLKGVISSPNNAGVGIKDDGEKTLASTSKSLLPKNIFLDIKASNESIMMDKTAAKRSSVSEKRTLSLVSSKVNSLSNSKVSLPAINKQVSISSSSDKIDLFVEPIIMKHKQMKE